MSLALEVEEEAGEEVRDRRRAERRVWEERERVRWVWRSVCAEVDFRFGVSVGDWEAMRALR